MNWMEYTFIGSTINPKKMEMNGAPMNDSLFNWILECLQKSEVFYHKHHIAIWLKPMMFRLPKLIYTNQFQY